MGLIYFVLALTFVLLYEAGPNRNIYAEESNLASFTALKPIQYRVLIPAMVHALHTVTHVQMKYLYIALLTMILTAIPFAFGRLLRDLRLPSGPWISLIILYPLVWNYIVIPDPIYPYDLPNVLFFTACLAAILERRYLLFYCFFVLGLINRETIVLLAVPFQFLVPELKPRERIAHFVAQAAIFVAIKLALEAIFANNPGGFYSNELADNWRFLTQNLTHDWHADLRWFIAFGGLYLLQPFAIRWLPRPLKLMAFTYLPIYLIVFYIGGSIYETRIFSELCVLFALGAVTLGEQIQSRKRMERSPQLVRSRA